MMGEKLLYKYRPVDKYVIDILVNHRLYLSNWANLNDAHEAQMVVGNSVHANPLRLHDLNDGSIFLGDKIDVRCTNAYVTALSSNWWSNLLWSHYAAGHSGIAIGLEIPEAVSDIYTLPVTYADEVPNVNQPIDEDAVLAALRHKSREWNYEDEVRVVSFDDGRKYLEGIVIKEINFGLKTTLEDKILIQKILREYEVKYWQTCKKPRTYKLNRTDHLHIEDRFEAQDE